MPRGSSATKRQQGAANTRDTRHENGLVGPGKRVQKQKSNGHLNGHAKSSENSNNNTPPPLPGTPPSGRSAVTTTTTTNGSGHVRNPPLADNHSDHPKMNVNNGRRTSVNEDSEFSSAESFHNTPAIAISQENHRQIDVNAAKNPAVHRDMGPFGFALTVLRSCPLGDTIAILIVLLQIPPTFLSIIHLLFATLTFVPPSATATAGLSFPDIFEGNLATPSVATILVIDFFVLMIWLFLWTPFQNVALDLAQTVIALTLGGGAGGKEAGMNNVLVCLGIIGLSHFSKNGHVKKSGLKAYLPSSWRALLSSSDSDGSLDTISDHKPSNTHGWIRSILAIHILTQGVVRYIRDWYVRREKQNNAATVDPEVGRAASEAGDVPAPTIQTPDAEPSVVSVSTSKKKRKQNALVRLRQPLWSALASTKIVMVKEYETSHSAAESAGTNATDINNLGNAPFDTESDRIWVTYVGPEEVFFSTSYFPKHSPPEESDNERARTGVDESKPFFVRVNCSVWPFSKISVATENESEGDETRWSGEIFGLNASVHYQIEFVSTTDGSIIYSASIQTKPRSDVSIGLTPNPTFTGRPDSPKSTLKTAISAAEVRLADERNRQKREKREQRAKLTSIRKEIEKLSNSIASGGGGEDRQRQRLQQHLSQFKQAEEATSNLLEEIEKFEAIPTDEKSPYITEKRNFQSQREKYKHARNTFNEAKTASERELSTLTNEISNLTQKQDRLRSRIVKLTGEHERIIEANARGLNEADRKMRERESKSADRARHEMMLLESYARLQRLTEEAANNLIMINTQIAHYEQMEHYQQQAANSPNSSVPNLSAPFDPTVQTDNMTYPWNMPGAFTYPNTNNTTAQTPRTRGRSSSMLSNISHFTQSSNEGTGPTQHFQSAPGSATIPNALASPFTSHSQMATIPSNSTWGEFPSVSLLPAQTSHYQTAPFSPQSPTFATQPERIARHGSNGSSASDGSGSSKSSTGEPIKDSPRSPIGHGNGIGNGNGNGKVGKW